MLVDNSVYRNSYVANGSTTQFAISFPFLDSSHVIVYKDVNGTESVVNPKEYSITGAGYQSGGTLTFNTAPAKNTKVIIARDMPITQLHKYTELDNFPAESHENALAKLTMICQQLKELVDRAVKVRITGDVTPEELRDTLLFGKEEVEKLLTSQAAIDRLYLSVANIDNLNRHVGNIDTVASNVNDVISVSDNINSVNTLAPYAANLNQHITSIVTTANNIRDVIRVSTDIANVNTLAQYGPDLGTILRQIQLLNERIIEELGLSNVNGVVNQTFYNTYGVY